MKNGGKFCFRRRKITNFDFGGRAGNRPHPRRSRGTFWSCLRRWRCGMCGCLETEKHRDLLPEIKNQSIFGQEEFEKKKFLKKNFLKCKTFTQPINQSIDFSMKQACYVSNKFGTIESQHNRKKWQTITKKLSKVDNQPINRSFNHWTKTNVGQSTNQSYNKSLNQSINQSIDQWMNQNHQSKNRAAINWIVETWKTTFFLFDFSLSAHG